MNLDKRTDRWESVSGECLRVGLEVDRFRAVTEDECGGNRFLAYNHTYHGILTKYRGRGKVLVLEDDVWFKDLSHGPRAVSELPGDWDVLYLGANVNGTRQQWYSSSLRRIKNSLTTHAVAYSEKMVDYIVENFNPDTFPIYDEWLRVNVQEQFNCFIVAPMIAWQKPGYSDLWQTKADYTLTFKDGNELLK